MCTAACLSLGAGATVAAPTVTVVTPIIAKSTPAPTVTHHAKKKVRRHTPKATPTATVVAARATPVWTPTPRPTVAAQHKRVPPRRAPLTKVPTGGGASGPAPIVRA